MPITVAYTFDDYIAFCKITNQKACYLKSLLDFKEFVKMCNSGLLIGD